MSILLGGSMSKNYRVVAATSYANLPATPGARTIGLITSVPVKEVSFSNEDFTMVDGDVVIRLSVSSSVRIGTMLPGRFDNYPSAAWQKQSGVLVQIDAYYYESSAWTAIYASFYEVGTIKASVEDFLVRNFSGTATLAKNADNMYLTQTPSQSWAYGKNKINLTALKTLHYYARSENGGAVQVGVAADFNVTSPAAVVSITNIAYTDIPLDVTALNGEYYFVFGYYGSSQTRYTRVQRIWGN